MRHEEQLCWDNFKKRAPSDFIMHRVENMLGEGMPDVFGFAPDGAYFWVELKAVKSIPRRLSTPLLGREGLRRSQKNWHAQAAHCKLRCYTLMRVARDEIFLVECEYSEGLNNYNHQEINGIAIASDWAGVFKELRG